MNLQSEHKRLCLSICLSIVRSAYLSVSMYIYIYIYIFDYTYFCFYMRQALVQEAAVRCFLPVTEGHLYSCLHAAVCVTSVVCLVFLEPVFVHFTACNSKHHSDTLLLTPCLSRLPPASPSISLVLFSVSLE